MIDQLLMVAFWRQEDQNYLQCSLPLRESCIIVTLRWRIQSVRRTFVYGLSITDYKKQRPPVFTHNNYRRT